MAASSTTDEAEGGMRGGGSSDHRGFFAKVEVPEPIRGLSKEDAPKVRAFETERFLLVFDDRSGSEKLVHLRRESKMNAEKQAVSFHDSVRRFPSS
jgi:hypothetical protein